MMKLGTRQWHTITERITLFSICFRRGKFIFEILYAHSDMQHKIINYIYVILIKLGNMKVVKSYGYKRKSDVAISKLKSVGCWTIKIKLNRIFTKVQ